MSAPEKLQSGSLPLVSIVVPCRNEKGYIAACLESIMRNDYPAEKLEVLVIDGESDDGTRDILDAFARRSPMIRWLDNPGRTAPAALNIGIRNARGDILMRMDAHCRYPDNYVTALVGYLERSGADNVGALWRTLPGSTTRTAKAIAFALSHPFGVGNAHYRIGITEPRWVDTVPFGCYRRTVFDRIGLFDEELIRNQDDEFNQRLLRSGGRILLVPDATIDYFARDSLSKVARMYYQYGYFKPLTVRKLGGVGTFRQIVPALLLLSLAGSLLLGPFFHPMFLAFLAILLVYSGAVIASSIGAVGKWGIGVALVACACFPVIHFSYAWGSIRGILDFFIRRLPGSGNPASIPISR